MGWSIGIHTGYHPVGIIPFGIIQQMSHMDGWKVQFLTWELNMVLPGQCPTLPVLKTLIRPGTITTALIGFMLITI